MTQSLTLSAPFDFFCPACGSQLLAIERDLTECAHVLYKHCDLIDDFEYVAPRMKPLFQQLAQAESAESPSLSAVIDATQAIEHLHLSLTLGGDYTNPLPIRYLFCVDFCPDERGGVHR